MHPEDSDLERELAQRAQLRRRATPAAFDAGFADRVMTRVRDERLGGHGLPWVFARVAPLAAAAALLLAVLNLSDTAASGTSVVDRLIGLPPVTLDAAYSFDSEVAMLTGVDQ